MEGNGVKTNLEVEATAFAGGIRQWMGNTDARLKNMDGKLEIMDGKIDVLKSQQDKWLGAIALVTGGASTLAAVLSIWSIFN